MSLPHSSLEIITTKEVTTKKSDLSNTGISSWDPSVESVEITFGLLFTSNAVWIWFAKILLHLQIYITLLFFLAAKAFKMSQSRYPESVWQSATDHVTEGEWRERGERGKCWGPSVSWYKSKVPGRNFIFHLKTTGSPYIWALLKWWVETSIQ